MADPHHHHDSGDDTGVRSDRGSFTGAPRWVKVFVIVVAILVLLVVAMMFIGGGEHGPGRHTSLSGAGGRPPLSGVAADLAPAGGDVGVHASPESGHRGP